MLRVFGVPIALLCLYWHFITTIMIVINYDVYIKRLDTNKDIKTAYLTFSITGITCYALIAAPLFVYAYKYAASLQWGQSRLTTGVAIMFLLSSLPIFVIELVIFIGTNDFAIKYPLDGIVFIISIVATIFGWIISWFAYMRCIARKLHKRLCYERQIINDNENIKNIYDIDYDNNNNYFDKSMRVSVFPSVDRYVDL